MQRGELSVLPAGCGGKCFYNDEAIAHVKCMQANSTAATTLLGLLGIVLSDLNVLVGIDCLPITVLGTGGACAAETLCCNDTSVVSRVVTDWYEH